MGRTSDRVSYIRGAFDNGEQFGRRPVWEHMSRGMIWVLLFLLSIAAWIGFIAAGWQLFKAFGLISG